MLWCCVSCSYYRTFVIYLQGAIEKIWDALHSVSHLAARAQAVEVRQGQPKKESNLSNRKNTFQHGGTGSEYLLRRLAKTAPDILDRYEAGEFKSVRAASIAAGHIKVATVLERLFKLWEKATDDERTEFKKANRGY